MSAYQSLGLRPMHQIIMRTRGQLANLEQRGLVNKKVNGDLV